MITLNYFRDESCDLQMVEDLRLCAALVDDFVELKVFASFALVSLLSN
jgi:hypothetical protein